QTARGPRIQVGYAIGDVGEETDGRRNLLEDGKVKIAERPFGLFPARGLPASLGVKGHDIDPCRPAAHPLFSLLDTFWQALLHLRQIRTDTACIDVEHLAEEHGLD